MKRSDRRFLTTHVGSLPRPAALRDLLVRRDRGEPVDAAALAREADAAVAHVVSRQLEIGIDVGNNGEQPRAGFSTYVAGRMRGFGGASRRLRQTPDDILDGDGQREIRRGERQITRHRREKQADALPQTHADAQQHGSAD